jgi:hypothetical protein
VVSDVGSVRAGRLLGSPLLPATRGVYSALVSEISPTREATERVSFDQLGLTPASVEVYGRAEISVSIDARVLPANTRPARLNLEMMVAPDGAGENAVVSVFVNERLLGSTVAASGAPTRLDLALPDGLFGSGANVRAVVQRRSAQGDCRFEPQGYPAQILGSSAVVLTAAGGTAHDFFDLVPRWANGIEILLPAAVADRPLAALPMLADVVGALSADPAPIDVKLVAAGVPASPAAPFVVVSNVPPSNGTARVRFDRGRIAVADRAGKTLLDVGGDDAGAVAQLVTAGGAPGIWIRALAADGTLPAPPALRLDRGDVAFIDRSGVALAMSTERDVLVRVTYPEHESWLTVAERFRTWIVGALWLLATVILLFVLQRLFRRQRGAVEE